jgi:Na+-transporting NADH:ubiquinone oxidoreductase subunit NqrF
MGILDNLEAYLEFDEHEREVDKCYYCPNTAINIKIYKDDIDGVEYDFPHCEYHQDINDMTQEAVDLWASQTTFE